jgi:hypothetical protein
VDSGRRLEVGPNGDWTPERLLAAAAESAVMTSFLELAEEELFEVLGYVSSAGIEIETGMSRVVRIVVRPCIIVAPGAEVARGRKLLARALERSIVASVLTGVLRVDADVTVLGAS